MPADPELDRLYAEVRRASETLVGRLESYGDVVISRPHEAAIADDVAKFAFVVERAFREWYERSRNLREELQDSELRPPSTQERPDADPRSGT
jgi:hypothetical protein